MSNKMSDKEIDNLEAGPELDAEIAEKVLGIEIVWIPIPGTDRRHLYLAHRDEDGSLIVWDYSSHIGCAWKVVEKLDRFHLKLNSPFVDGQPWFAGFTEKGITGWNGIPDFNAKGDTAPVAICRAALKTVSREVNL